MEHLTCYVDCTAKTADRSNLRDRRSSRLKDVGINPSAADWIFVRPTIVRLVGIYVLWRHAISKAVSVNGPLIGCVVVTSRSQGFHAPIPSRWRTFLLSSACVGSIFPEAQNVVSDWPYPIHGPRRLLTTACSCYPPSSHRRPLLWCERINRHIREVIAFEFSKGKSDNWRFILSTAIKGV